MAPLELDKLQYFYARIKVQLDCLIWGKRPSVCILEIICIIDFQTSLKETGIYHLNCDRQNVCPCYFIKIIVIALWIPGILSCPKFFFSLCGWELGPLSYSCSDKLHSRQSHLGQTQQSEPAAKAGFAQDTAGN